MTYHPTDQPLMKHVMVGSWPIQSIHDIKTFHSKSSLLSGLLQEDSVTARGGAQPSYNEIAHIYTYQDVPPDPKIGRVIVVIGYIDRDLVSDLCEGAGRIMSTKFTIGVKRADGDHVKHLKPKDVKNSNEFAKFVTHLHRRDYAAAVKLDKFGRVGLLMPWNTEGVDVTDVRVGGKGSYACVCYFCQVDDLRTLIVSQSQSHDELHETGDADDAGGGGGGGLWQPPGINNGDHINAASKSLPDSNNGLWQPPGIPADDSSNTMNYASEFAPTTFTSEMQASTLEFPTNVNADDGSTTSVKRKRSPSSHDQFHQDGGAAAADRFYSGLTREKDTRADSRLFHMRAFNGWVKATQIAELNPQTKSKFKGMRILDLACGKGGDLGKWTIHPKGVSNYVGIDVARGSLRDAARRVSALPSGKLKKASFVCADLGADVPGSTKKRHMLETWTMNSATVSQEVPQFYKVRGGGISPTDKFDVVSIQFAIHYMMSSKKRARRFFKTVGSLLDIGGTLIATTIDARVIVSHLMSLGLDLTEQDKEYDEQEIVTVSVGNGACRLKFKPETVRRIFAISKNLSGSYERADSCNEENEFGLEYTFTLSEGDNHAAGVGEAVDLPEWLTPIPVLKSIAAEVGLRLDSHENFHEFYKNRSNPKENPMAHNALYNMHVLDRTGSISRDEWEISRLYAVIKFTKVIERNPPASDGDESDDEEKDAGTDSGRATSSQAIDVKKIPLAMSRAKKAVGNDKWKTLSSADKKRLMKEELALM